MTIRALVIACWLMARSILGDRLDVDYDDGSDNELLTNPVLKGNLKHCDKCVRKDDKPHCYFPDKYETFKEGGTPGFATDTLEGCKQQRLEHKRFDNVNLDAAVHNQKECVQAYYVPATARAHSLSASGPEMKVIRGKCKRFAATLDGDGACTSSCSSSQNKVAELAKLGDDTYSVVLIVANTPKKPILLKFLDLNEKNLNVMNILKSTGKYLSGTATSVGLMKQRCSTTDCTYLPAGTSGPKGGDVEAGALIATGRVRALFFLESYTTECHKCDISALKQICNAQAKLTKKNKDGKKTECAYDYDAAVRLVKTLAGEIKK